MENNATSTDFKVTDYLFMFYSDIYSHHVYFRAVSTFFQLVFVSLANVFTSVVLLYAVHMQI